MFKRLEKNLKKLSVCDIALVKLSSCSFGVMLAVLLPILVTFPWYAWLAAAIVFGIVPLYRSWK